MEKGAEYKLHVLPKGGRRIRSYGFLHHSSKKLIKFLQVVLWVNLICMVAGRQKKRPGIRTSLTAKRKPFSRKRISVPQKRPFLLQRASRIGRLHFKKQFSERKTYPDT